MARIKGNLIMMNVSGMIGKQVVVKTRDGKQYLSGPPTYKRHRVLTPNQQAWAEKFKEYAAYAKYASNDPELRPGYLAARKNGESAYLVAFRDARYPPEVTKISVQGYNGRVGDVIVVQATDDFKVNSVWVFIYSATGVLIEDGIAESDGMLWMYRVTRANENINGCRIVAKAYDLPRNEGVKEVTIL
jgi:hypothetical protein